MRTFHENKFSFYSVPSFRVILVSYARCLHGHGAYDLINVALYLYKLVETECGYDKITF